MNYEVKYDLPFTTDVVIVIFSIPAYGLDVGSPKVIEFPKMVGT